MSLRTSVPDIRHPVLVPVALRPPPAEAQKLGERAVALPENDVDGPAVEDVAARLLGAVLQEQWRRVGVDLELRSLEQATLYADITRGSFQLYTLRWVGANNDPDMFEFVFSSRRMPPNGANRGHYSNPKVDELIEFARREPDMEKRKEAYRDVQRIIAEELPYISLFYMDNVCVSSKRIDNIKLYPAADFDFLTDIRIAAGN